MRDALDTANGHCGHEHERGTARAGLGFGGAQSCRLLLGIPLVRAAGAAYEGGCRYASLVEGGESRRGGGSTGRNSSSCSWVWWRAKNVGCGSYGLLAWLAWLAGWSASASDGKRDGVGAPLLGVRGEMWIRLGLPWCCLLTVLARWVRGIELCMLEGWERIVLVRSFRRVRG